MPRKGAFFMDHYTAEAYEHVRKRIVGKIDELVAYSKKYPGQKPGSGDIHNLKNWRRFGAGFAWDPEVYIDIMANPDMSDVELMRALRNTEDTLMKKWGVIDKMPLHHKIALRTGGDLGLRTPVDVWMQTRARLYERFGFNPGNGPANLGAHTQFNELVHQEKMGGGKEFKQSGAPASVIEEIKQAEVGLHRSGQDLGNLPKQYNPLIGASSAQQAAYLEDYIIAQVDRFKQATDFERTKWMNATFDGGMNWFVDLGGEGPRISGFSSLNSIEDQELMKQAAKAIKHFDETTGEIKTLSQLTTDAFVAPKVPKLNTKNLYFDVESKEGKKALQMIRYSSGGAHLSQDFQRLAKQRKLVAGAAGLGIMSLGPLGTAASATELKGRTEIAAETDSWVDKTQAAIAGTSLAADLMSYNPVTVVPATLVSTGADVLNLAIDGGRAFLSGDATLNRRKLERQEKLRAKPADAPERENALSVGFAGGM